MTYYYLREWPVVDDCPAALRAVAANLLQTHVLLRKSTVGLSPDGLWRRPHPEVYSIGNVLLHVCGSEHQWIHSHLGGRPLVRDRDPRVRHAAGPRSGRTAGQLGPHGASDARGAGRPCPTTSTCATRGFDGFSAEFILHYTAQHLAYHAGQMLTLRRLTEPAFEVH